MAATITSHLAHPPVSVSTTPSSSSSSSPPLILTASKFQNQQQPEQICQSTGSTSISSLFERVTNFRRSLIKSNQTKKNKSVARSTPSVSLNLFNKSSSASTATKCPTNGTNSTNHSDSTIFKDPTNALNIATALIEKARLDDQNNDNEFKGQTICDDRTPTLINNPSTSTHDREIKSPAKTSVLIHVDEEDAIYGFTSMYLNNPSRRLLKKTPIKTPAANSNKCTIASGTSSILSSSSSSSSSSSTTSSSSLTRRQHLIQKNNNNNNNCESIFTSSSCISLYETIDECQNDDTSSEQKQTECLQPKYSIVPNRGAKSSYHSKIYSSSTCTERKRNRSSSAILLGTDATQQPCSNASPPNCSIICPHSGDQQNHISKSNTEFSQKQDSNLESNQINLANHSQRFSCSSLQARSSDDILMMSSNSASTSQRKYSASDDRSKDLGTSSSSSSIIYENLKTTSMLNNRNNSRSINQRLTAGNYPDPRKLTKDSGYESSSTLVNLSTGSATSSATLIASTNSMASDGSSLLNRSSGYGMLNTINSTSNHQNQLNHTRSDSIDSNLSQKSFDLPPSDHLATASVPSTPESHTDEGDEDVASSPPAPPIRYSSLPEHYRGKCSNDKFSYPYEIPPPPPPPFSTQNHSKSSWPYNLYPKMRRKQRQQQQQQQQQHVKSDENPYDNGPDEDKDDFSPPPLSIHKSGYSMSYYTSVPTTQVVRSHPVQPIVRQETRITPFRFKQSDYQGPQSSCSSSIGLAKNNPENIKEIQKRAVYEFYLRQKEKKNNQNNKKEITCHNICDGRQTKDCGSDYRVDQSPLQYSDIKTEACLLPTINFDCESNCSIIDEEKSPTSPSNPSFSPVNDCVGKESEFPPPPSFLKVGESDSCVKKEQQHSLIDMLPQRHVDLMNCWSSVDLSQLVPILLLVSNANNQTDDDDEFCPQSNSIELNIAEEETIQQELIQIDQTRKWKQRMLSRKHLLLMEKTRIQTDLISMEKVARFIMIRLSRLDETQKNKLDLLCADLIRIIGLIFSIYRQLDKCRSVTQPQKMETPKEIKKLMIDGPSEEEKNYEKLTRLEKQLDEARQLHDGFEQRCLMFIERVERRFNHLSFSQLLAMINQHDIDSDHHHANNDDGNIGDIILSVLNQNELFPQPHRKQIGPNDLNLPTLCRWYLKSLEALTIQQNLIDFLISQEIEDALA